MRLFLIFATILLGTKWSGTNEITFDYEDSIHITSADHHPKENITSRNIKNRYKMLKTNERSLMNSVMMLFGSEDLSLIDVSYLNLTTLEGIKLPGPQLGKFNASHNKLWDTPANFFIDTPNLHVIDLSYNRFTKIDSYDFEGANNVITINLSYNRIRNINVDTFEHLINLEFVDLSDNQIKVLDFKFANRKPLDILHLENNPIEDLQKYNFCMDNEVTQIHYSWNEVRFMLLPEGNQFDIIVNTEFNGIKSKSKHKYEFHCKEESFKQLMAFKGYPDTTGNVLTILRCFTGLMTKLDLSGNFIEHLDAMSFEKFSKLGWLNISDVKLVDFDFDVIRSYNRMRTLDISFNDLKHVHNPSVLKRLIGLSEFHAAGNQFDNTEEILKYLSPTIQVLDLSDSTVALTSTTFDRFLIITELKLRNTNLSIKNSDPFASLQDLRELDISLNNFRGLEFTVLRFSLNRLWKFRCAYCQIENAENLIQHFKHQSHVKLNTLDLSGNSIGEINGHTFEGLEYLKDLDLSNTSLSALDFETLKYSNRLEFFKISHNKLRKVDFKHLSRSIKVLDLEWNDIVRIDNLDRSQFPELKLLKIAHNQFLCENLVKLVQEWNETFIDNPWVQKHGEECRPSKSDASKVPDSTEIDPVLWAWLIVALVLGPAIVVIALGIAGLQLIRRRLRSQQNIQFQNDYGYYQESSRTSSRGNEPIYEEIGPPTNNAYDNLKFDTDPLPLSISKDWYDKPRKVSFKLT